MKFKKFFISDMIITHDNINCKKSSKNLFFFFFFATFWGICMFLTTH